MALRSTNIFADDHTTERLAEFFDDLYGYLLESSVPEDRLPSPWHVLSRVVRCIDPELLREWLDAYSAVEGEPEDDQHQHQDDQDQDETTNPHAQTRPPKRRPSYLRALEMPRDDTNTPQGDDHDEPQETVTPSTEP